MQTKAVSVTTSTDVLVENPGPTPVEWSAISTDSTFYILGDVGDAVADGTPVTTAYAAGGVLKPYEKVYARTAAGTADVRTVLGV